ncbi:tRNA synthetases class I (C) catalytic domain-containing protein, partial [Lentinula detonsa]
MCHLVEIDWTLMTLIVSSLSSRLFLPRSRFRVLFFYSRTIQTFRPMSSPEPVLKIYNYLSFASQTEFIPKSGRSVKWYNCGPTVYDASHMGHARNYVTQDVLRRIMTDYFGYDVQFIIKRARQNHLLEKLRTDTTSLDGNLISHNELAAGLPENERLSSTETDQELDEKFTQIADLVQVNKEWRQECLERDERFDMNFTSADAENSLNAGVTSQEEAHKLIDVLMLCISLISLFQYKSTVTDPSLSRTLASHWESLFSEDMRRLHVRDPDTLTRVTEYMPEIITFVDKILNNGYAYESEGSVYTKAFDDAPNHDYAKLEPWSKGKRYDGIAEASTLTKFTRRSASDFALWKASKPGEPSWESPWGAGRPGWHIECSVMASAVLGENMDIHSGGIDLAFPHHDNEMAQSEAYHDCPTWVNYFVHTGHLHIEGLKMSKSLKNFITIDEILQKYTARQIRLTFLTQLWNAKVDFSESLMSGEVRNLETTLNDLEKELVANCPLRLVQHPEALDVLRDLVSRTNTYINSRGKAVNLGVVQNIARWVGKMLRMFGLGDGESSEIGWGQEGNAEGGVVNREEILMSYLRTLSTFRDGVRRLAIDKGDSALKDILALCDKLRDEELIPLGVALDDQEGGKALVKLAPPSDLLKARDEKRAIVLAKQAKKEAAKEAEQLKRLERLTKGKLDPREMFRPPNVKEGVYGSYDESGVPLTDGEGKEISKSARKKLLKEREAQAKLHEEYLKSEISEEGLKLQT